MGSRGWAQLGSSSVLRGLLTCLWPAAVISASGLGGLLLEGAGLIGNASASLRQVSLRLCTWQKLENTECAGRQAQAQDLLNVTAEHFMEHSKAQSNLCTRSGDMLHFVVGGSSPRRWARGRDCLAVSAHRGLVWSREGLGRYDAVSQLPSKVPGVRRQAGLWGPEGRVRIWDSVQGRAFQKWRALMGLAGHGHWSCQQPCWK